MSAETWKVMVNGAVYDSDLETLKQWIMEGRVQPIDKVQKGSLPWTAARNVPALREVCAQCNPPLMPLMPDTPVYQMQPPMMQGQLQGQMMQGQMQGQMMQGQMMQGQMQGQMMQGQMQGQMMPVQYQPFQSPAYPGPAADGNYYVNAAGFEGRQFYLKSAGLFSSPKLLIDGSPAPKGPKRGQFFLRRNDGREVVAQLRGQFIDPVPKVMIDGETISLVEPFKWYEWIWLCLPLVLLFLGGAIGGFIGGLTAAINGYVFRSKMNGALRFILTGAISGAAVVLYFVIAVFLALQFKK
jgi:hypothetical protein